MKKIFAIMLLTLCFAVSYTYADMYGHMMKSRDGDKDDDNYSYYRMRGRGMMGRGMMGYGGYGMMGAGMMGYGGQCGMMGPGMMGYGGHMGAMMGPGMMGRGMWGYDQEEYEKYMDDTVDLRKKLHDKRFEFFETIRKRDVKRKTIMNLEKEMRDLQWQIYEKSPENK